MRRIFTLALACGLLLYGCASGPSGNGLGVSNGGFSGGNNSALQGRSFTTFTLTTNPNGQVDRSGQGYYCILLNALGDAIEVTNLDTFTDMIRFDGFNFQWFHRQARIPPPGFILVFSATINENARVSADGHIIDITFRADDATSPFNQFLPGTGFTAHAIATDALGGAVRGRVLDAMGPGPSLDNNALFTIRADKLLGALTPLPAGFPEDAVGDFLVFDDLPVDYPYVNFDIVRFQVLNQRF